MATRRTTKPGSIQKRDAAIREVGLRFTRVADASDIPGNGRKATVPENDQSELFEAIREQLSPHAVASIASHLQGARTNNQDVDRQVHWFTEELCRLLGGYEQQNRLAEEMGL